MTEQDPTIKVKPESWSRLNARKSPGETFNDVVERLLDATEDTE